MLNTDYSTYDVYNTTVVIKHLRILFCVPMCNSVTIPIMSNVMSTLNNMRIFLKLCRMNSIKYYILAYIINGSSSLIQYRYRKKA